MKGLSHMNVFMAGASSSGLEKSQALDTRERRRHNIQYAYSGGRTLTHTSRTMSHLQPRHTRLGNPPTHLNTHVTRLSHSPLATLASVLAASKQGRENVQ